MQLLVLHGVADSFVVWLMENYRSFIRNHRVENISSELDAVIKKSDIWLTSHRFPTPALAFESCSKISWIVGIA